MSTTESQELRGFFGLKDAAKECHFYLPAFRTPSSLASVANASPGLVPENFSYRGHTFAERDAKAASYISTILGRAVEIDQIKWAESDAFCPGHIGTVFLLGSRSNQAASWATSLSVLGKFIQFEFGRKWSIRCANQAVYSLLAPNTLSREAYERKTDYGVIGRFQDFNTGTHIFLIAGLGGRATEGCAYHLAQHWKKLAQMFLSGDFALVLKFPPPVDPKRSEAIVAFDDQHTNGFEPAY